jgi:NADH-quinone oxidoreductase subunit M
VLGFFPKPLLDIINPSVEHTMSEVGTTDPQPNVTEGEATK